MDTGDCETPLLGTGGVVGFDAGARGAEAEALLGRIEVGTRRKRRTRGHEVGRKKKPGSCFRAGVSDGFLRSAYVRYGGNGVGELRVVAGKSQCGLDPVSRENNARIGKVTESESENGETR